MSERQSSSGRVLGLDYGSKRIGVAVSDAGRMVATPLVVVANDDGLMASLAEIVGEYDIELIVVGMPTSLDGSQGPAAARAEEFVKEVASTLGIRVQTVDERFTTVTAERALLSADVSRAKRRKSIDKVAAAVILQSFLDRP